MTPTAVQSPAGVSSGATAAASTAIPFGSANAAGNLLTASLTWDSTSITQVAVTDTQGNTWQQAPGALFNDTAGDQIETIWYAENCKAGANAVTAKYGPSGTSAVAYRGMIITEYSGIAASGSPDGAHGQLAAASSTPDSGTSGSWTTTADGDLIVGVAERYTVRTMLAGTGFTIRQRTSGDEFTTVDRVQTTHGSVAALWSPSGVTSMLCVGAAFKAAGSSSPATGTASVTATASGAVGGSATGTASASVTAAGTGRAPATGTGSVAATASGNAGGTAAAAAAADVTAAGTAAGQQATTGTAQAAVTAAGSASGSIAGTASATATAAGSASARAAGTAAISVTAAGTAHGGGVIKAMTVGPVSGPALARTVTGPAVSPGRSVVGPALARTVTGPAVARTITGPGV